MILAGDFVPQSTLPSCEFHHGDWLLCNLEAPVCAPQHNESRKIGPHLRNDKFEIPPNTKLAFALANNHIMDYGFEGLKSTVTFLNERHVEHCGAGDNIESARLPLWLEESDKKIAVISCCETQFGVAGYTRPGVAEVGLWVKDCIKECKKDGADYVIVSCHAASELSPFVSPRIRDFYHMLVDCGADIIHGHHSHVPQGYEVYRGCPIFYGLGNFVIDKSFFRCKNQNFFWSLVVRLDFSGASLKWEVRKCGDIPTGSDRYLEITNFSLSDTKLIDRFWQSISVRLVSQVYSETLFPIKSHYDKVKRKVKFFLSHFFSRFQTCEEELDVVKRHYWLMFACGSHRDAIKTGLGVLTGAIEDCRTPETESLVDEIGGIQGRI